MPDLQSELAKINAAIKDLQFDDEEEAPETAAPNDANLQSKTTTQRVFDYVAAHPNSSSQEVSAALGGVPTTIFSQLTKRGVFTRTKDASGYFRYTAAMSEYKAMSIQERLALAREIRKAKAAESKLSSEERRKLKQREYNRRHVAKVKAAKAKTTTHQPAPAPAPAPEVRIVNSVDELIESLSLKQARELYDKLRSIFGG